MSRLWYIYQNNAQKGPFTEEEMNHYISSAGIKANELAWSEGMDEWIRVEYIQDFHAALREAPGQFDYPEEKVVTESHYASEPEPATPTEPAPPPADDYMPKPSHEVVSDKKEETLITPEKKAKNKTPVIATILALLLIGAGLLTYNLIADRPEEIAEEPTAVAVEETAVAAGGEDYLIAFTSNHLGPYDLFVIDTGGQNMVRLTESEHLDLVLSWSPDGTAIVFDRYDKDDLLHNIYMLELDNGNLTRLHEPGGNLFEPAWSPDGSQIVCVGDLGGFYMTELWLMDPDGGNLTQLTDDNLFILSPAWSPDGNKLVFVVLEDTYIDSEIYVIDTSGENLTQLTDSGGMKSNPAWSPDGTKIIFSFDGNDEHEYDEIYIMEVDGSDKTRLTEHDLFSRYPAWSPDGSKIIYSKSQRLPWSSGNFPAFYTMDPDGGNPNRITEGLSFEERAAWSPLKLDINKLGDVMARDGLDPDILLGEWQGEYEGITIEYRFSAEEMESTIPDRSNIREYRIIPYFSVLNLEFNNIYSEEWEGYGQVEIIDQDTIIIRDFYLYDELSDDIWEFYIEVPCVRVGG